MFLQLKLSGDWQPTPCWQNNVFCRVRKTYAPILCHNDYLFHSLYCSMCIVVLSVVLLTNGWVAYFSMNEILSWLLTMTCIQLSRFPGDKLLYLDPHFAQPAVDIEARHFPVDVSNFWHAANFIYVIVSAINHHYLVFLSQIISYNNMVKRK